MVAIFCCLSFAQFCDGTSAACVNTSPPLRRPLALFPADARTLTPVDGGIMNRLELVREQRRRQGACVPADRVHGPCSRLNYQPNYNCITLHTCSRSQWTVNKYSHIISTSEWRQRANRPTGDTDVLPIGPNLVQIQPSLMRVNNKSRFIKRVSVLCDVLRLSS